MAQIAAISTMKPWGPSDRLGISKALKIAVLGGFPGSLMARPQNRSIKSGRRHRGVVQPKSERGAPARAKRPKGSRLKETEIEELFCRFAKANPNPTTELAYRDPFTLLVAVVLSAQATDASVNRATPDLFRVADTPRKLIALGEAKLTDKIKTIGLYRSKAKNLIALAKQLVEQHGGEVPGDREALEALAGVGRKTANVVLNTAFGAPTIAVDTHAFRVANRTCLGPGKTPLEVEETLNRAVPERYKHNCHHWLILHGRYVCKARLPECWRCLVADICRYTPKSTPPG
jgi:endonuclease-3